MYSPLNSGNSRKSSLHGSLTSCENSLNDVDGFSPPVELGDLASTALLKPPSPARFDHGKAPISTESDTSYKNAMPSIEEADTSFLNARESTRPTGWWSHQMLVDRSTRIMAACMTCFAVIMLCTCIALAGRFHEALETNKQSTSIPIASGPQTVMNRKSEALKFFINVAATMVLGMSNTYQQILTALHVDDLKHVLTKYGDSRVGTNSPFSIKHKREGRILAWIAWFSLIFTSMPVHLLANSLVGVSNFRRYDVNITWNRTDANVYDTASFYNGNIDCWTVMLVGEMQMLDTDWSSYLADQGAEDAWGKYPDDSCPSNYPRPDLSTTDSCMIGYHVTYNDQSCGQYVGQAAKDPASAVKIWDDFWASYYQCSKNCSRLILGTCSGNNFTCEPIYAADDKCDNNEYRLVIRMQAAIVLAFCLTYKAGYMLITNFRSRNKVKTHLLTFGDVLMASVLDPTIQLPHESMVNGGSFHRRQIRHTCHKHCRNKQLSETGEELGHCQKCSKHNKINNMTRLAWPAIATKRKQSLLSNLGQTALTQMLTLSFSSIGMIVASVFALLAYISQYANAVCWHFTTYAKELVSIQPIADFHMDNLSGEIVTFFISNGAQLLYSMLYMLLIYNVTLISMEQDWGRLEKGRKRLRCTIVKGPNFDQSYLLQLPKQWLYPLMVYSIMMHWLLGLAIYAEESTISDGVREFSKYSVVTVPAGLIGSTVLMLFMTIGCWRAFSYCREGFIPQMYGSIRTLCSATSDLDHHPMDGIQWGDLGKKDNYRHAGLSGSDVGEIIPNELYA